ncbi:Caspase domain protein [compost metagenome]
MPTPTFRCVSLAQFQQILKQFEFTRAITSVHMHHTWRPRRADFRGHQTIVGMWRHHTETNGWNDIAQHITIDPDGQIWLGRNWNAAPASAKGHNGNRDVGPFMFEMIGDFDRGADPFDGQQKETALGVIAAVLARFDLADTALRFHNTMSSKSCPGSSIDYQQTLRDLADYRLRTAAPRSGLALNARVIKPFADESRHMVAEALQALRRADTEMTDPADAELDHGERNGHDTNGTAFDFPSAGTDSSRAALSNGQARARGALTSADLAALRPHLINLTAGRLSSDGEMITTPADVDAIFEEYLPQALETANGRPVRILFYAHGGLVSESTGLRIAHKQVQWWRHNHVYPIHFAWETGLFQAIAELLGRLPVSRGLDPREFLSDPLLELFAHNAGGVKIWGAMKASAQRAAEAPTATNPIGGGAYYVATKLAALCNAHPGKFELHAVGHSAGSLFHAFFVPLARHLKAPRFKSLQFLAPAVRIDTFKDRLLPQLGNGDGHAFEDLTVYTMRREYERRDHCAHIYGKSLLYLIHHALEDRRETPILGLEDSLRADADLKRLFRLGVASGGPANIVWSPGANGTGRGASQATAHGDFDDDPATMNSLARHVLALGDADPIVDFPDPRDVSTAQRSWQDEIDWPAPIRRYAAEPRIPPQDQPQDPPQDPSSVPWPDSHAIQPAVASALNGGRRLALCVGIDAYPDAADQLGGCVNDARRWSQALAGLGFEPTLLLDGKASHAAIEYGLRRLLKDCKPGDVVVFQFSGHGTQVDDLNGDENDGLDEALCPVDFRSGALFLDDDIGRILEEVPRDVNMTLFIDSCHSGTVARFAVGAAQPRPPGSRARYVRPTPQLQEAHRLFRTGMSAARAAPGRRGRLDLSHVKFSACQDNEQALERNGSGDFTRHALHILQGNAAPLNHAQFQARLLKAFGPQTLQRPRLDCADGIETRVLLQPLSGHAQPSTGQDREESPIAMGNARSQQAVQLLSRAMQVLTQP